MPVDQVYNNLIAQRAPTPQEQDIERMTQMYKGLSGNRPQQPPTPQQATNATQTASPASRMFPTPSFANMGGGIRQLYQGLIQRLSQGAQNISPWGQQARVTQGFNNYNPQLYADVGNYNRGTDVGLGMGTRLRAPRDLTVRDIRRGGWNTGWGNTVELYDPRSNEAFRFSHLADTGNLSPGDIVRRGMGFGTTGNTGRTTGPHLDLEYKRGNQLADVRQHYPEWFRG